MCSDRFGLWYGAKARDELVLRDRGDAMSLIAVGDHDAGGLESTGIVIDLDMAVGGSGGNIAEENEIS